MIRQTLLKTALVLMTGTIAHGETMAVPETCEPMATVHREICMVSNYIRCGDRIEVHSYTNGEISDSHYFGQDWDLVGYQADGGRTDVEAAPGSAPEASLTTALETGESLGSREMTFSTGVLKGNAVVMDSELRMGAEEVEISGHVFRTGTLKRLMTVKKNGITSQWSFEVYATPDASLFIEGKLEIDQFGKTQVLEWTPRQVSFPGDDGFMTTTANSCS